VLPVKRVSYKLAGPIAVLAGVVFACQPREPEAGVPAVMPANITRVQLLDDPVLSKMVDYTARNPLPFTPENVERGKQLYQLSCIVCHGLAGEPEPAIALRPTAPHFSRPEWSRNRQDGELFQTIQQGRPFRGMPSWKHFPARDTWAVIHYVRSLSGTAEEFAKAAETAYAKPAE